MWPIMRLSTPSPILVLCVCIQLQSVSDMLQDVVMQHPHDPMHVHGRTSLHVQQDVQIILLQLLLMPGKEVMGCT